MDLQRAPRMHYFAQANPSGPGEEDVPALLRRVAGSIESIGEVCVHDITFENDVTANGLRPSLTVYFRYGALDDDACGCGSCEDARV